MDGSKAERMGVGIKGDAGGGDGSTHHLTRLSSTNHLEGRRGDAKAPLVPSQGVTLKGSVVQIQSKLGRLEEPMYQFHTVFMR